MTKSPGDVFKSVGEKKPRCGFSAGAGFLFSVGLDA
jgi:hypothetical protein